MKNKTKNKYSTFDSKMSEAEVFDKLVQEVKAAAKGAEFVEGLIDAVLKTPSEHLARKYKDFILNSIWQMQAREGKHD